MSDESKLKDVDIEALSVFPSEDDPSLAELLLRVPPDSILADETIAKQVVTRNKNASAAGSKSRKSRRRKSASAKTRTRARRSTDNSFRRAELMRAKQEKRDRDKKQSKNQARVDEHMAIAGQQKAEQRNLGRGVNTRGNEPDLTRSLELSPHSRPAILGLFDYHPWYKDGETTTAGNVALINSAKKILNLRSLISKDDYTDYTPELPKQTAVANYSSYHIYLQNFLSGLDVLGSETSGTVVENVQDAFSYLALDEESASSASNTEIITTLLRDFCSVLQGSSPRLMEADTRGFEPGPYLPTPPTESSLLCKYYLASSGDQVSVYEQKMSQFDVDQVCKILINTISQEIKMSINKNRTGETSTIDEILGMSPDRASMMPTADGVGPLGDTSGNGLSGYDGTKDIVLPFEAAEVSPTTSGAVKSARDVVTAALKSRSEAFPVPTKDDGTFAPNKSSKNKNDSDSLSSDEVYNVVYQRYNDSASRIYSLLDYTWCTDSNVSTTVMGAEYFSQYIFRSCLTPLKDVISEEGVELTKVNVAQLYFICMAAADIDVLKSLLLYLAALRDYVPPEPPPEPQAQPAYTATKVSNPRSYNAGDVSSLIVQQTAATSPEFTEQPFTSAYSAASSTSLASSTVTTVSPPPVETSKSTYTQSMSSKAVSSPYGSLSGAQSGNYLNNMINPGGGFTHSFGNRGMYQFINDNIGAEELSAEEFVSEAFSQQAADIASFVYKKISEAAHGSNTPSGDVFSHSIDEQELAELLANEPLSNNIMTRLLTAWENISNITISQNGITTTSAPDHTCYSNIPLANLETAFLIAASKLLNTVLHTSFTTTSDDVDTEENTIHLDASAINDVSQDISALWSSASWETIDRNQYLQQAGIIQDALALEEQTSLLMSGLLSDYFNSVKENWRQLTRGVSGTTATVDGAQVLMATALTQGDIGPLSADSWATLMSISEDLGIEAGLHKNSPAGTSLELTVDKTGGDNTQRSAGLMWTRVQSIDDSASPSRVLAIGLPNGLLGALRYNTVSLDELDRESHKANVDVYELTLEKIDAARSDIEYEPKKYYFPRRATTVYWDASAGWQTGAQDSYGIKTSFREPGGTSSESWTSYLHTADDQNTPESGGYGTTAPENKAKSEALKLYLEHMYGVSLRITDFPKSAAARENIFSSKISIPALKSIDTSTNTFLSASNLAFMSDTTKNAFFSDSLPWWSQSESTIDVGLTGELFPSEPEQYSLMRFLNTYGTMPSDDYFNDLVEGVIFEDIVCIEFDHRDWQIKSNDNPNLDEAEEEVPGGIDTSQGLEFGQYRVTIRIPEINEISEETS